MFENWNNKKELAKIIRERMKDKICKNYGGDQRGHMLLGVPSANVFAVCFSLYELEEMVLTDI
jgi:hypothetical protein